MSYKEYKQLFLYAFIFWIIVSVLMTLMTAATMFSYSEKMDWFLLLYEFICLLPWILATPLIFHFLKRYPLNDDLKASHIYYNIGLALIVFVIHTLVQVAFNDFYWGEAYLFEWKRIRIDFISFFQLRVLFYLVLVIGFYTYQLSSKRSQYLIAEARLKSDINKAKFDQLHTSIHPFLLINTIDASIEKCEAEPLRVEPILHRLSELVRMQLKKLNQEMLTIEQNLTLLTKYTELIGFRRSSPIPLNVNIPSNLMDYRTPSVNYILLILEDLIYHKSDLLSTLKSITIKAERIAPELFLTISLDGGIVDSLFLAKLMSSEQQQLIVQSMNAQLEGDFKFSVDLENGNLVIKITIQRADYITTKYNQIETVADIKYLTT